MEQQIRFVTSADGVRICYATVGKGPPLVKAPNWLTHLEYDWESPVWRHWWAELAKNYLLVRFDQRGNGLSDWDAEDLSVPARVNDLEAVVNAVGLERFALIGISQGGATAIEYQVSHPERVSHLILCGAYARGAAARGRQPSEESEALLTLMKAGWGRDDPAYRQIFTSRFMPDATAEQMQWFNELQRVSASPENAVRSTIENSKIDVTDSLERVSCPTLVLHSRHEIQVPFSEGRELAALIPDARFVPLESKNHLLIESEPAWQTVLTEVRRFLGTTEVDEPPVAVGSHDAATGGAGNPGREARELLSGLEEIALSRYSVIPGYAKYDEGVRNVLKDARQKIVAAFHSSSPKRENHLIWASPGSGKTYFVERISSQLADAVDYREINLAKLNQGEFLSALREMDEADAPTLCLIDEIDAKPDEPWPYEALLPYLDAAVERGKRWVFVLAGSSGSSVDEMKRRITSRPKGTDLQSRIPGVNEYEIPSMSLGDRMLVVLSQFRGVGKETGKDVQSVEKFALYYVALTPLLANARQLREFAVRAVGRMPLSEDRVKYDHLFDAGDQENKEFYMRSVAAADDLVNKYVQLED